MKKQIILSERLKCICDMVSEGYSVADVGCDHGFVSIYLVLNKISPKALGMDVNAGPLERCAEHIKEYGLSDRIKTRLSNGLREYEIGEADSLVIAGMGGPLMQDILSENWEKTHDFKELILSPQSEIKEFREFLYDNGYHITDEKMLLENGKYYVVMKTGRSDVKETLSLEEYSYGPVLLRNKDRVLKEYLEKERSKHNEILCKLNYTPKNAEGELCKPLSTDKKAFRVKEIENELDIINKTLCRLGDL